MSPASLVLLLLGAKLFQSQKPIFVLKQGLPHSLLRLRGRFVPELINDACDVCSPINMSLSVMLHIFLFVVVKIFR